MAGSLFSPKRKIINRLEPMMMESKFRVNLEQLDDGSFLCNWTNCETSSYKNLKEAIKAIKTYFEEETEESEEY